MNLKERAGKLKTDIPTIFLALKDKDTPMLAKILAGITVAYALSPVDLVPEVLRHSDSIGVGVVDCIADKMLGVDANRQEVEGVLMSRRGVANGKKANTAGKRVGEIREAGSCLFTKEDGESGFEIKSAFGHKGSGKTARNIGYGIL